MNPAASPEAKVSAANLDPVCQGTFAQAARGPRNDRGSVLPMAAGLVALCGVAIVGIVDAAELALARTNLQSTADMAALVGAESFDPSSAVFDGTSVQIRLTDRPLRRDVRRFIRDSTSNVRLVSALTPDGVTARVVVRTVWAPPLVSGLIPLRVPIEATASARAVFGW